MNFFPGENHEEENNVEKSIINPCSGPGADTDTDIDFLFPSKRHVF